MITSRPWQDPAALRSQTRKFLILRRPTLLQICSKVVLLRAAGSQWQKPCCKFAARQVVDSAGPTLSQICDKVLLPRAASARWIFLLLVGMVLVAAAKNRTAPPWEKPLETGRYLFLENCSVCHEINGPKSNKFGPSLFRLFRNEKMPYSGAKPSEENVASKIKAGGFIMPSFRNTLTDDQIEKIVAYLRSKH